MPPAARSLLAFVIEDQPSVRKLLRELLEREGFFVAEAATARAALRFLADHQPDLICVDLILPEVSGFEVCAQIRGNPRLEQVPLLVISGRSSTEDQAQAQEFGASAFLAKPFGAEQFSRCVRALLPGADRRRSATGPGQAS